MKPVVRKLTMQTYRAQIALRERMSESLAKEFDTESLTREQKAKLADRLDRMLKEKHAFQLMLDLMERQDREAAIHLV